MKLSFFLVVPFFAFCSAESEPLTSAEKAAVGNALAQALGVMSGKVKSGDKFEICMEMFPNGAPPNAAQDATWQSCRNELPAGYGKPALIAFHQPLTSSERAAVGKALAEALGVMSGKVQAGDKFSICSNMFPNGAPADADRDATWLSCKNVIPQNYGRAAMSLIARNKQPMTSSEKAAVGNALSKALGVMSGNVKSQDKFSICMEMFPNGAPSNAEQDATWLSCKDELPASYGKKASLIARHTQLYQQPLTSSEQAAIGNALSKALGVMSGKVKSDDKFSICMDMFPNGAPTGSEQDATWLSCKDELPAGYGQPKPALISQKRQSK